jgi:hypothetical protein
MRRLKSEKSLRRKWRGLPKLVAMIGGFLILGGIVLLGLAALAITGYLNVGILLERKYLLTFAVTMVAVGLLDAFSAIIIARW